MIQLKCDYLLSDKTVLMDIDLFAIALTDIGLNVNFVALGIVISAIFILVLSKATIGIK